MRTHLARHLAQSFDLRLSASGSRAISLEEGDLQLDRIQMIAQIVVQLGGRISSTSVHGDVRLSLHVGRAALDALRGGANLGDEANALLDPRKFFVAGDRAAVRIEGSLAARCRRTW